MAGKDSVLCSIGISCTILLFQTSCFFIFCILLILSYNRPHSLYSILHILLNSFLLFLFIDLFLVLFFSHVFFVRGLKMKHILLKNGVFIGICFLFFIITILYFFLENGTSDFFYSCQLLKHLCSFSENKFLCLYPVLYMPKIIPIKGKQYS